MHSQIYAIYRLFNDFYVTLVLLRIPNPQPIQRILPESVRVRIRESFAAISDGFGSSVRESIFTYQLAAFKRCCVTATVRVWPPVRLCGRLNGRAATGDRLTATSPRCLVWSVK